METFLILLIYHEENQRWSKWVTKWKIVRVAPISTGMHELLTFLFGSCFLRLGSGPLLLLLEKGQERDVGDFDDLESDAGNVSHGVTGATETRHQHFVVLLDVVQTTILPKKDGAVQAE